MLLGCFAVFWTIYYTLEVLLTHHKGAALDLTACSRARACPWAPKGRTASGLEDGTEMEEAVPLCLGEEVEVETETVQAAQEGHKGPRQGEAC